MFCDSKLYLLWTTKLMRSSIQTCPVRRGVSAATFDATGLGDRTGHVYKEMNEEY